MIMDIASQQRSEISQNETHTKSTTTISEIKPATVLKRSFDVAFLMMPDDRIRQKQQLEKQARLDETIEISGSPSYPKDLSPRQLIQNDLINPEFFNNNNNELRRYPHITIRSPRRVYDDPTILPDMENPKSAFTKVPSSRLESPIPPPPPLSPDQLSCPSLSPPISTTPPRSLNSGSNGSNHGGNNTGTISPFYHHFRPEYQMNGAFQSVGHVQALAAQNNRIKQQLMYRPMTPNGSPELISSNYLPTTTAQSTPFPYVGNPFAPQQDIIRNPAAAAVLSALIPPTLASTFSLTAQNVCAKCNISFRMTSDLVYHMRSHHKSEVASDPNRRKRQEKLKCPVCNESFRERHHLTRHMTAHQDKDSDQNHLLNNASAAVIATAAAAAHNLHLQQNGHSTSGGNSGGNSLGIAAHHNHHLHSSSSSSTSLHNERK